MTASFRWNADVQEFDMSEKVTAPGKYELIYPTDKMKTIDLQGLHPDTFKVADDQYLIDCKVWKTYIGPKK